MFLLEHLLELEGNHSLEGEDFYLGQDQESSNRMAEREGFEPSVALLLRSLSKGVLSTTQPPFQSLRTKVLNHSEVIASTLCSRKLQLFEKS